MNRREFLGATCTGIATGDRGYCDLSLHGNPRLKTPQLDRLASQRVEFLTGRYALRCGCGVHRVPNVLPERSPHGSAAPDMTWTRFRGMTYMKSVELRRIR